MFRQKVLWCPTSLSDKLKVLNKTFGSIQLHLLTINIKMEDWTLKKTLALLLTLLLILGTLAGCGKTEKPGDDKEKDSEKATITFVHGYYHDESEWPAASQMRQMYQDFADMHKDEFTFVAVPDESGAEGIYNTALNDISGG